MNWQKHYDALISRARGRMLEGYSEKHHVMPRCLGGDDSMTNLVRLTPEEHFVAHQLLVKLHPESHALVYAARMMAVDKVRLVGRSQNKLAGWLRRRIAEVMSSPEVRLAHSERAKNNPEMVAALKRAHAAQVGVPRTKHVKEKLSAFQQTERAAQAREAAHASRRGAKHTDDAKQRISETQTGRKHSQAHRDAISAAHKGKVKSAEHVAKIAAALTGKPGTRRGAVTSEETKQKMREAALRRHYPDGVIPDKVAVDPKFSARARKAWETKRAKAAQQQESEPWPATTA